MKRCICTMWMFRTEIWAKYHDWKALRDVCIILQTFTNLRSRLCFKLEKKKKIYIYTWWNCLIYSHLKVIARCPTRQMCTTKRQYEENCNSMKASFCWLMETTGLPNTEGIKQSWDLKNEETAVVVWQRKGTSALNNSEQEDFRQWGQPKSEILNLESSSQSKKIQMNEFTQTQADCWRAMTLSVCVSVCVPVCVSFQSVHASVPLIILIWLCLLLSCLAGDKAEGPSLAHSLALYYRAGWAMQDWAQLTCSQAIGYQEEKRRRGNCEGMENEWGEGRKRPWVIDRENMGNFLNYSMKKLKCGLPDWLK